jgi:hypothetical protein
LRSIDYCWWSVFVVDTTIGSFGLVTSDVVEAKKAERAQRFGLQTDEVVEAKKQQRAERFGLGAGSIKANQPVEVDLEKLKVDNVCELILFVVIVIVIVVVVVVVDIVVGACSSFWRGS